MRWVSLSIVSMILVGACASDVTVADYAEQVEALVTTMNARLDELDVAFDEASDLDDIKEYAKERVKARTAFLVGMKNLESPESVAELRDEAIAIMGRVVETETAMSAMIQDLQILTDVESIWDTPEGVAARVADARAVVLCEAAQEGLDTSQAGSDLEGVPWIPNEMKRVVRVAFGCHAESR